MKKNLILFMVCALFVTTARAQNEQGQSAVTLGVGYSILGSATKAIINQGENVSDSRYVPSVQVTFDHALTDLFSLGLAVGYQQVGADFTHKYKNDNDVEFTEQASIDFSRLTIAARPLLHYGGTDRLDLYSGFRVGLKVSKAEVETTDPNLDVLDDAGNTGISLGIIPFGMRYHVTDNFGFHADIQIGAPYIVSGGIALKF